MIEKTQGMFNYVVEHWQSIALIASEVAALVSVKYSGIIQGFIKLIGPMFRKNKRKS